jgi:hypothetical protein
LLSYLCKLKSDFELYLQHHPFILKYSDSSLLPAVAQWVRQQLIIHSTAATAAAAAAAAAVDNIALRQ